jgi:hypothetical protein
MPFETALRHLSSEKSRLEQEMEKLLEANIELATESKKLLGMCIISLTA